VDHPEQLPEALDESLAIGPIPRVRQRRQELHITNQMRQADLEDDAEFAMLALFLGGFLLPVCNLIDRPPHRVW
jgi:hypothetical protein